MSDRSPLSKIIPIPMSQTDQLSGEINLARRLETGRFSLSAYPEAQWQRLRLGP